MKEGKFEWQDVLVGVLRLAARRLLPLVAGALLAWLVGAGLVEQGQADAVLCALGERAQCASR